MKEYLKIVAKVILYCIEGIVVVVVAPFSLVTAIGAVTVESIIEGGCHSYYAYYGSQKGDGTPTITRTKQIEITVNEILKLIVN
mgnify:CR=1 FL=1